jgi:hypothetical protein
MAQAVEFLPSKPETLIQTPVPPPLKKKEMPSAARNWKRPGMNSPVEPSWGR